MTFSNESCILYYLEHIYLMYIIMYVSNLQLEYCIHAGAYIMSMIQHVQAAAALVVHVVVFYFTH